MPKYIDADELIALLVDTSKRSDSPQRDLDLLNLQQIVHLAPVADVAPVVHARWERQACWDSPESGEPSPRCSACHETNLVEKPYCPNCGAIMDLEEVKIDGATDDKM